MNFKIGLMGTIFTLSLYLALVRCSEKVVELPAPAAEQSAIPGLRSASIKYYVAKTGNDRNTGNLAAPFLTIQKGLSVAGPGDTVFVKAGTYSESLYINKSGTTGYPITLKNYGTDVVTVDGTGTDHSLYIDEASYITIDGLNVLMTTGVNTRKNIIINSCIHIVIKNLSSTLPLVTDLDVHNIKIQGNMWCDDVTVDNVTTYGGSYGVFVVGKVKNSTIKNCEVSYAHIDGICVESYGSDPDLMPNHITCDNVYSHHNGREGFQTQKCVNITIKNSHASYNAATGIQIESYSYNALVEDNLCEYNSRGGGYAPSDYEGGIWIAESDGVIARRNIMRGNEMGLIVSIATNFQAYNNIIINNNFNQVSGYPNSLNTAGAVFRQCNGIFYNNTLYGNCAANSQLSSIAVYPTNTNELIPCNVVLKNNIVMNDGGTKDLAFNQLTNATVVSDHNLVYNSSRAVNIVIKYTGNTWSNYKSLTGQDAHSLNSNPIFVDPQNGNFKLQPASPGINAGVNVGLTSDFLKNGIIGLPDIGAIEYTQGQSATVYYNTQVSSSAVKNDCGTGYTGSTVTYTVAAGKYSSIVSQADADSKAAADLSANAQTYANANGTCTAITPTIYYNIQVSATATKNDCGTGYTGSTVTYTVAAGNYSSSISQADADSKAAADLSANKQSYANANGNCTDLTVYYNTTQSGTATKNDCGTGYSGSTVTYIVAAGTYSSTLSQTDANNKSIADVNANKQAYANANGTCTAITATATTIKKSKKWWQR